MAATTERIQVLVTKAQKAFIAKKAIAADVSVGEFLRQAAESYEPEADADLIDGLLGQVRATTAEAMGALDETLAFVAASERRIARMERKHTVAKAS
jgi:hypothetical protein